MVEHIESTRGSFGKAVKAWREAVNVTQAELEEGLGMGKTYVARLEAGRITPPSRKQCERIAVVLRRNTDEVWSVAAPERLLGFDEALLEWHMEAVRSVARLDAAELRLVQSLRTLPPSTAPALLHLVEAMVQEASIPARVHAHYQTGAQTHEETRLCSPGKLLAELVDHLMAMSPARRVLVLTGLLEFVRPGSESPKQAR